MDVKYDFDDPSWDEVSEDAKDLIRHLLVKDPNQRYTAKQCLEHRWVQGKNLSQKKTISMRDIKSLSRDVIVNNNV